MNSARFERSESPQLLNKQSEPCQGRIKRRNGYSSGRTRFHSTDSSFRTRSQSNGRVESRGTAGYNRRLSLPQLDATKLVAASTCPNWLKPSTKHNCANLEEVAIDKTLTIDEKDTKPPVKFQDLWEFGVVEVMDVDTFDSEVVDVACVAPLVASETRKLVEGAETIQVMDVDTKEVLKMPCPDLINQKMLDVACVAPLVASEIRKLVEGVEITQVMDVDTKEVLKMPCPDVINQKFAAIADVPEGAPVKFRSPEAGEISVEVKAFLREYSANPDFPAEIDVVFDL